jgi:hypothetical protein
MKGLDTLCCIDFISHFQCCKLGLKRHNMPKSSKIFEIVSFSLQYGKLNHKSILPSCISRTGMLYSAKLTSWTTWRSTYSFKPADNK